MRSYQDAALPLLTRMRSADRIADALGRTARYGKCPRRELQAISRACTRIEVQPGTVLARQGEPGREFVIALTGGALVMVDGRDLSAILAGDHFGDVALLSDRINPATVVAETPMSLAVVGAAEFSGLLDRCPAVARAVLHTLTGRLRAA